MRSQSVEDAHRASTLVGGHLDILESISSGVMNFDRAGRITYANRAAREIFSLKPGEALGRDAADVFCGEVRIINLIREALDEQRVRSRVELPVRLGGRREVWLGISTSLLRDAAGAVDGATFILSDITEVRRLQEEVATKERLAALGEMSAGIAHELRNSVGTILGFARLLECQLDPRPGRGAEPLGDIVRECKSMEGVLQQFLDFTKPAGLMPESVSVPEIVGEALRLLESRIADAGVSLECNSEPTLPPVMGDPLRLRQAFTNVAQNAIEAMAEGDRLVVSCYQRQATDRVTVRFADTGVGIAPENLERIFNPFFTLKDDGVGLGLSLVHKIVSAHGGEIHVESELGRGTTVVILLPVEGREEGEERE
jgi:PAS domain S-box-containing protein